MNIQKTSRILAAPALLALMAATGSTCRAASLTPAGQTPMPSVTKAFSQPKMALPESMVVIKIGDALLEEYHGGRSDNRTELIRGQATMQMTKASGSGSGS